MSKQEIEKIQLAIEKAADSIVDAIRVIDFSVAPSIQQLTLRIELSDLYAKTLDLGVKAGCTLINAIPKELPRELTPKELEVLICVAKGLTGKAMCEQLGFSYKTLDTHITHIKIKLHSKNKVDLIKYALLHGLVEL